MLEWIVIGGAVFVGTALFRTVRRGRLKGRWTRSLEGASKQLTARATSVSLSDGAELRAEAENKTVTLKITQLSGAARAEAQVALPDENNTMRFYLGWDVAQPPAGLEHVPAVPYPGTTRIDGNLMVRADDPTLSHRFLEKGIIDLTDLRRSTRAKALEVITRGGYLSVIAHGLPSQEDAVTRMVKITAKLAVMLDEQSKGTMLPAPAPAPASTDPLTPETPASPPPANPPASTTIACELCTDVPKPGESWVRCARCHAPYHASCFHQAAACIRPGCGETRFETFQPLP